MKKSDDQIDFNFSRALDIQKNLNTEFLEIVLVQIKTEKKKYSFLQTPKIINIGALLLLV